MFLPNINVYKRHSSLVTILLRGHVAQTITCQIADAYLTADTEAESSISAWSNTLVEI